MNTVYANNDFRNAMNAKEEADRTMHAASQEHLREMLEGTVSALMDVQDGDMKEFIIKSLVRDAMQEALSTREATASYALQLTMPI